MLASALQEIYVDQMFELLSMAAFGRRLPSRRRHDGHMEDAGAKSGWGDMAQ
jgi:hypothetical protein